jgi:hypothetical protein
MATRTSSPKVIVVDGGEIVMDQGVSVNHLQGTGKGKYPVSLASCRFMGGDRKNGPDSLPPGQEAVSESLVKDGGIIHSTEKTALEG